MKKIAVLLILLYSTAGFGQLSVLKFSEYGYFIQPYVEDAFFSDIHALSKTVVKNNIAKVMHKEVETTNDGEKVGYYSWKPGDSWQDNIPQSDFVGVAITQEHTAYPAAEYNYRWNSFGYDLSTNYAFNLIIAAQNVHENTYAEFIAKVAATNKLLGIQFTTQEENALKNRKPFLNANAKYTYVFFDQGIVSGDSSYTYSVVPVIKTRKEIKKLSAEIKTKDIRKDTLSYTVNKVTYATDNPDSLKQLLIGSGLIPKEPATIYPMYFSLAKNDTTVFTIVNTFYGKWFDDLPAGSFIIVVYAMYADVGRIEVIIKNDAKPATEQIESNYNKLKTLYKVMGIEITKDLDILLKNAAATDENTPQGLEVMSGNSKNDFSIHPGLAKVNIYRPHSPYTFVYERYTPNKK